mmetsp:Transcript_121124/g.180909  ORF Transcript_121124/g.180909 Transcript_121124/m.180909 type:complete len:580 (+) Transcript_121124:52-1791(+)
MKLDPTVMRTMSGQDFRVLEAVEKGMNKHSLVPAPLIASLASLRHGGTGKILSGLLRDKLLSHDRSCGYDGYRLTNAGYDILALHALKSRKCIAAIGDRIGTGKESDVYLAVHPNGQQVVLKFHRLGRTSFRNVKKKRDYFVYNGKNAFKGDSAAQQQQSNSWLFLSRKSALKEFAFMKALYNVQYPTPEPIAHNRHIVAMSLVRGVPLYQIRAPELSSEQAASIFHQASALALRLAKHGLVHCDLNEFNLLVDLSGIQQTAISQEHDPYVRHSGLSVAAESAPGMLSARGPWEPERLQQFAAAGATGEESVVEEPPKPVELLDNGEAKPIVVLIDFPQMVSTLHPNAAELYERDTACLYKFFSHKLQFQIPESDRGSLYLSWESVQKELEEAKANNIGNGTNDDNNGNDEQDHANTNNNDTESICLANRAQLRLDQQLKASGYSDQDANRDSELYYYFNQNRISADSEKEDEPTAGDDDGDGNDNIDDDDGSLESVEEEGDDAATGTITAQGESSMDAFSTAELAEMSMRPLQEQARQRVRQQLDMQKKKSRQRGAFRKHNSSKTYEKGKRVYQDIGM